MSKIERLEEIFNLVHKSCVPQLEEAVTKVLSGLNDIEIITGVRYDLIKYSEVPFMAGMELGYRCAFDELNKSSIEKTNDTCQECGCDVVQECECSILCIKCGGL